MIMKINSKTNLLKTRLISILLEYFIKLTQFSNLISNRFFNFIGPTIMARVFNKIWTTRIHCDLELIEFLDLIIFVMTCEALKKGGLLEQDLQCHSSCQDKTWNVPLTVLVMWSGVFCVWWTSWLRRLRRLFGFIKTLNTSATEQDPSSCVLNRKSCHSGENIFCSPVCSWIKSQYFLFLSIRTKLSVSRWK